MKYNIANSFIIPTYHMSISSTYFLQYCKSTMVSLVSLIIILQTVIKTTDVHSDGKPCVHYTGSHSEIIYTLSICKTFLLFLYYFYSLYKVCLR